MFLTAAPYFQKRFAGSDWIQVHFLSAIMLTATITNLVTLMVLTKIQANASYQKRIAWSLLITIVSFVLLTISTVAFEDVGATAYFVFVLGTVLATSLATGMCQNGLFAYVTGFGRAEYTQAIMMGQGIAGVLPCIARSSPPKRQGSDVLADLRCRGCGRHLSPGAIESSRSLDGGR